MAPLVRTVLLARRAARIITPGIAASTLSACVVWDARDRLATPYAIAVGLGACLLMFGLLRKRARAIEATSALDIQVGIAVIVAAFAVVVRVGDSLDNPAYPIIFICLALISALTRPGAAVVVAVVAGGLEVVIRRFGFQDPDPLSALPHLGFMGAFVAFNSVLLRAEIARLRTTSQGHLEQEVNRLRDDARSYRLLGAGAEDRAEDEQSASERLARSGVEEIHQSVLFALRLLRESLQLHTAMLLWQNDAGTHLRISELASDSPDLCEGPFLSGDGVFGAALARRSTVSLSGLKATSHVPYYQGPCPVAAVCVIPVFEHGQVRGALVVDRIEDQAFTAKETQLIEEAGRYAVRAIHNERVFVQLERAKVEQGKLYRAAEALGAASTETDVIDAGVHSAREIASIDFAAITLYDESSQMHEISAVSGDGSADLVGQRFRHNTGLVSMVLENRHPLPYRGEYDSLRQVVFTKRVAPPQMPSLIVLPLVVHERPLGTLVLASRRASVFTEAARNTLEVLASHMAVSLETARMVRRLEELATMDGLTGLLNKRAMLDVADEKITAAKRFGRQLSVLITDIDLFKRVNDTYGHDVGDVIIKGLADILRRAKRNTDAVARFGGEEFVIICEETDAKGAMLLAERVRTELERTIFSTKAAVAPSDAKDTLQVTCSVGVATFPGAGETWESMFKAADDALYVSKRTGRNRCSAHQGDDRQTTAA